MAATHNTTSTLNAQYKEVYGDSIEDLVPETAVLSKDIPFSQADKIGDKFVFPVALSQEHGITYLGENAGVETLEDVRAAVYKEAQVDSSSTILRASIGYSSADKMASSKQSFMNWSEMLLGNMTSSLAKRDEIAMLYGQSGVGTISAVSDSSGTNTVTLSDFAMGIWAGMEGARVDVYASNLTTKRNSNAEVLVTSVDFANNQLVLDGNSTDTASFAQNDVIFFKGANAGSSVYKEMAGLNKIITNTGTLFNIAAGTYNLWKGHTSAVGSSRLTLAKILKGVASPVALGLTGDYDVLVNPMTYKDLNTDQAALRRYGAQEVKADNGFRGLMFEYGAGVITVKNHIYCKPTDAFGYCKKEMKRIGTTDITFKLDRAAAGGDVFLHIPDKSGYEIRCRSDQAIFSKRPAWMVKWSGITNA